MGVHPIEPLLPPHETEGVHRVERDAAAQEFGQKNPSGRKKQPRRPGRHNAPCDSIEVSGEYRAASPESREADRHAESSSEQAAGTSERHLDIRV